MDDFSIPVYRRNGEIAGVARVDAADYARFSVFRWFLNTTGYAVRYDNGPHWMHREVLGDAPFVRAEVDHVNRDRIDNRKVNLRWVTHAQNMQNRPVHRNNTSGARGVYFDRTEQKWCGQVKAGGRKVWRRYFNNPHDAAAATAVARRELLPYATA